MNSTTPRASSSVGGGLEGSGSDILHSQPGPIIAMTPPTLHYKTYHIFSNNRALVSLRIEKCWITFSKPFPGPTPTRGDDVRFSGCRCFKISLPSKKEINQQVVSSEDSHQAVPSPFPDGRRRNLSSHRTHI